MLKDWPGYDGYATGRRKVAVQMRSFMECHRILLANHIDFAFSLDIDEYAVPFNSSLSLVDALVTDFSTPLIEHTNFEFPLVVHDPRLSFTPSPHIIEPIDSLTIEAYKYRYHILNSWGPKQGRLLPKRATRLSLEPGNIYASDYQLFVINCCGVHTCGVQGIFRLKCIDLLKKLESVDHLDVTYKDDDGDKISEIADTDSKFFSWLKSSTFPNHSILIHHYARSLEKYNMKLQSWSFDTYNLEDYMQRAHGWTYDESAARYSCAVRFEIRQMTGLTKFRREGDMWLMKTYPS